MPIIRNMREVVDYASRNIHPKTVEETVGPPTAGRNSGAYGSIKEVLHKTYIEKSSGALVNTGDRLS